MNKNTLWLFVVLLIVYLTLVYGEEENVTQETKDNAVQSESTDLFDEARTRRRHHHLKHLWGWHALAIAYWIKVKLVIVAFFVGSAVFVGLRYIWPHKCNSDIVHEGPILYENPHGGYAHHDHIPYSLDHSDHIDHSAFDTSSSAFEPYSAYESTYTSSYSDAVPSTAPDTHRVGKRSVREQDHDSTKTEEQIAEFMFSFLGLDSKACRRRFICEMEFRSQENPLTSMAFRIVGRGFFAKYTNGRNVQGPAQNFAECAVVNSDCVFIEQDVQESESETEVVQNTETETVASEDQNEIEQNSAEHNISNDSDTSTEQQNSINLQAEKRGANVRHRGDRKLNVLAERILTQINQN